MARSSKSSNNSPANLGFEGSFAFTTRRLAVMNLALRGIEADLLSASVEVRMSKDGRNTSTFEIRHSNFA